MIHENNQFNLNLNLKRCYKRHDWLSVLMGKNIVFLYIFSS